MYPRIHFVWSYNLGKTYLGYDLRGDMIGSYIGKTHTFYNYAISHHSKEAYNSVFFVQKCVVCWTGCYQINWSLTWLLVVSWIDTLDASIVDMVVLDPDTKVLSLTAKPFPIKIFYMSTLHQGQCPQKFAIIQKTSIWKQWRVISDSQSFIIKFSKLNQFSDIKHQLVYITNFQVLFFRNIGHSKAPRFLVSTRYTQ